MHRHRLSTPVDGRDARRHWRALAAAHRLNCITTPGRKGRRTNNWSTCVKGTVVKLHGRHAFHARASACAGQSGTP